MIRPIMINFMRLLDKAETGTGLTSLEARRILHCDTPEIWERVFEIARQITRKNFHKKIRFFAPLYFSSICVNDCAYCGFKRSNPGSYKRALSTDGFLEEAKYLWNQGHRSLLLVAAEHPVFSGALRIAHYLWALERAGLHFSISIEVGPLEQYEYRELAEMGVERCVLYQETYHRKTYAALHRGPKQNFNWRMDALGRAMAGGVKETGLGFLLGLHDFREEVPALIAHAQHLETCLGRPPATFSLPRLTPARGNEGLYESAFRVNDTDFERITALLKIALPKTGLVLTTRESPAARDRLLALGIGVTHLSAGVSTKTGGYQSSNSDDSGQFEIQDRRSLHEMISTAESLGYTAQGCKVPEKMAPSIQTELSKTI